MDKIKTLSALYVIFYKIEKMFLSERTYACQNIDTQ